MDTNPSLTEQASFIERHSQHFVSRSHEGWKRGTSMTKLELSKKLGILLDPESNRVDCDADVEAAIKDLVHSFAVQSLQSKLMGRVQKNLWLELLPWHSYN